jgi:hypothetical protein
VIGRDTVMQQGKAFLQAHYTCRRVCPNRQVGSNNCCCATSLHPCDLLLATQTLLLLLLPCSPLQPPSTESTMSLQPEPLYTSSLPASGPYTLAAGQAYSSSFSPYATRIALETVDLHHPDRDLHEAEQAAKTHPSTWLLVSAAAVVPLAERLLLVCMLTKWIRLVVIQLLHCHCPPYCLCCL